MKNKYCDVFEVTEWARDIKDNSVRFCVKIDLMGLEAAGPHVLMGAIRDAVESYVKENAAAKIYENLETQVELYVLDVVRKEVERRCIEIISQMDMKALANLATIGASKTIGYRAGE